MSMKQNDAKYRAWKDVLYSPDRPKLSPILSDVRLLVDYITWYKRWTMISNLVYIALFVVVTVYIIFW